MHRCLRLQKFTGVARNWGWTRGRGQCATLRSTVTSHSYIFIQYIYVHIYFIPYILYHDFIIGQVLCFGQPWPLLLIFPYSLYTYIYTYILYILYLHFIRGQVLRFDQLWPLLLTLRWLQQTLDYWGSIDISSTGWPRPSSPYHVRHCTLQEETIPSLFSEIKLVGII